MRVVCVSDTHGFGRTIDVPAGDLLVHAGDLTMRGTENELVAELGWLDALPHRHKIVVAGNHDWTFDPAMPATFHGWALARSRPIAETLRDFPSLTYLCDAGATVAGYRVYGSPWQPNFHDWAFNFPAGDGGAAARAVWAAVPDDVEILVTHGPPQGTLDLAEPAGLAVGCPELRARVAQLERLHAHVFGHIHEAYGSFESVRENGATHRSINASICTLRYAPSNAPVVFDLPDRVATP